MAEVLEDLLAEIAELKATTSRLEEKVKRIYSDYKD
jgi:ubiquinone biosynthesis protein UbiJ